MNFHEPVILGRTGIKVGRLGIASGYGAPTATIEEAFERGCNYFTWGTVIKGYKPEMRQALKNIVAKGRLRSDSDIDLYVVGRPDEDDVYRAVRAVEDTVGRRSTIISRARTRSPGKRRQIPL